MEETTTRIADDEQTEYVITDSQRLQIERSFTYHAPFGDQPRRYNGLRETAKQLAYQICAYTKPSREQSLALTNLEQAIFWANAAIARNETNERI